MIDEAEGMDIEQAEIGQEEAPQSLRDQLSSALETVKESRNEEAKETSEKPLKARQEDGKFAKQDKTEKAPKIAKTGKFADTPEVPAAPVDPEIPMPKSYSKTVENAWKDIPKEIKAELNKREAEYHRELTKQDEERLTGKQFKDIVTPYMAQIRAEGGDPMFAVQNFFNMAHILRTGTPQQKAKLLMDTANQFGVNLNQAQQNQPRVDPVVGQLQQSVQQLQAQLQAQQQSVRQQQEGKLVELVNTFASDTANYPHFASVEAEMMALLQGGMFKDETPADRLKKVYDYAVHANPQTRSSLIESAARKAQEQRVADQKAKADAARKAGSSIRGKPGMLAAQGQTTSGTLRDQLREQIHVSGRA